MCFESELHDRAAFGGDEYLDDFAVYDTGKGYQHIVTYGMSELYPSMAAFGAEYSKWGYEMTMKVRESYAETGTWALDLLAQLARYTYQTGNFFEPGAYIPGDGSSLHPELNSAITGLAIVSDTTVAPIETVHGKVAFLQLVGLTQPELDALARDPDALDAILRGLHILDYNLHTVSYPIKNTRIPGFVGSAVVEARLALPLLELWNALLSFAPYGGIGIKTTLGMGGVSVEPLAPPQKLR